MVRTLCRRGAAGLQLGGGAGVRGQQPAAAGHLVHGPAHQRMAKAKPPRLVRGTHEVRRQQLVQRRERDVLLDVRRDRGQLELEWVARDRRALEHAPGAARQRSQLSR
jgi:hypothetical protein